MWPSQAGGNVIIKCHAWPFSLIPIAPVKQGAGLIHIDDTRCCQVLKNKLALFINFSKAVSYQQTFSAVKLKVDVLERCPIDAMILSTVQFLGIHCFFGSITKEPRKEFAHLTRYDSHILHEGDNQFCTSVVASVGVHLIHWDET